MATNARGTGSADTSQVIRDTAIRLFFERGYHGTSIRDIAGEANVGIATLFHHHHSKEQLLSSIISAGFDELLGDLEDAVAGAGQDPTERLSAVVRTHVRRHCESPMESAIAAQELRSLHSPALDELAARRDRVHALFASAVADGVEDGSFACDAPRETARAVHGMCSAVTSWYRPAGPMRPEDVAALYVGMALRLVGAHELDPVR